MSSSASTNSIALSLSPDNKNLNFSFSLTYTKGTNIPSTTSLIKSNLLFVSIQNPSTNPTYFTLTPTGSWTVNSATGTYTFTGSYPISNNNISTTFSDNGITDSSQFVYSYLNITGNGAYGPASDTLNNTSYTFSNITSQFPALQAQLNAIIATSNICFLENTPINTDQGIIFIEKIDTNIHTINHKPILHITKIISIDKYLVCFDKNALGLNYPNEKTIMSKKHKILYKNKLIEADEFVGNFKYVTRIKYNGEILYNVLMKDYSTVKINNIICETLHPSNFIAKLYTSNLKQYYKNKIIIMINDSIMKKDFLLYKRIIEFYNNIQIIEEKSKFHNNKKISL